MKVQANKKQEVIITLSDNEASILASILYEAHIAYEDATNDNEFMKVLNKPEYCGLRTMFHNKGDMSDNLYDLIRYAQGFYVDREGFNE